MRIRIKFPIPRGGYYGNGVSVAVGSSMVGSDVDVGAVVLVGSGVDVDGEGVSVSGSVGTGVEVFGSRVTVMPGVNVGTGVMRGGTFGTHRSCPERMFVEYPRQLPC
jgi:hypothetical protein